MHEAYGEFRNSYDWRTLGPASMRDAMFTVRTGLRKSWCCQRNKVYNNLLPQRLLIPLLFLQWRKLYLIELGNCENWKIIIGTTSRCASVASTVLPRNVVAECSASRFHHAWSRSWDASLTSSHPSALGREKKNRSFDDYTDKCTSLRDQPVKVLSKKCRLSQHNFTETVPSEMSMNPWRINHNASTWPLRDRQQPNMHPFLNGRPLGTNIFRFRARCTLWQPCLCF